MSSQPVAPAAPTVSIDLPDEFQFGPTVLQPIDEPSEPPTNGSSIPVVPNVTPLDALSKFNGTFRGFGFNTIFRPNSRTTPTPFPKPPTDSIDDNTLQLNLTTETMAFGQALGNIPNRGLGEQADIMLNGRPYTQTIRDAMPAEPGVTVPPGQEHPTIHFETGLWMRVPEVAEMPTLGASYCRMASIPHGTTINAQGFQPAVTKPGAPEIPTTDITPILIADGVQILQDTPRPFNSQTASDETPRRLPQDLTPFAKDGTITQDVLTNPNSILTAANNGKTIVDHTFLTVSTIAPPPELGGGTSNIGFNIGADGGTKLDFSPANRSGNANAVDTTAQYWISTVRAEVHLEPSFEVGKKVSPARHGPRDAVPEFVLDFAVHERRTVTVEYTQIQYSQLVTLDFAGLKWPHVTVATLAPSAHGGHPKLSHHEVKQ